MRAVICVLIRPFLWLGAQILSGVKGVEKALYTGGVAVERCLAPTVDAGVRTLTPAVNRVVSWHTLLFVYNVSLFALLAVSFWELFRVNSSDWIAMAGYGYQTTRKIEVVVDDRCNKLTFVRLSVTPGTVRVEPSFAEGAKPDCEHDHIDVTATGMKLDGGKSLGPGKRRHDLVPDARVTFAVEDMRIGYSRLALQFSLWVRRGRGTCDQQEPGNAPQPGCDVPAGMTFTYTDGMYELAGVHPPEYKLGAGGSSNTSIVTWPSRQMSPDRLSGTIAVGKVTLEETGKAGYQLFATILSSALIGTILSLFIENIGTLISARVVPRPAAPVRP